MTAPLDNTAIDALRVEIGRRIDSQTRTLCTFLSIATAAILVGFAMLAAVLYEAFDRVAAE
ncbi:MAG: hypothetical protein OXL36_08890 [Bryobacterales bacterium]|nr:hypothetical protein [Bryobacterales bacterium]MDE0293006.1 hypothetical protein [Bryobacterales bacterium]